MYFILALAVGLVGGCAPKQATVTRTGDKTYRVEFPREKPRVIRMGKVIKKAVIYEVIVRIDKDGEEYLIQGSSGTIYKTRDWVKFTPSGNTDNKLLETLARDSK